MSVIYLFRGEKELNDKIELNDKMEKAENTHNKMATANMKPKQAKQFLLLEWNCTYCNCKYQILYKRVLWATCHQRE